MSDTSGTNSPTADPVADDIDERNADSGDHDAGDAARSTSTSTSDKREHAADERTDAAAAPIQPAAS